MKDVEKESDKQINKILITVILQFSSNIYACFMHDDDDKISSFSDESAKYPDCDGI